MTTIDEVTMELFEGIKTAQREGNLLFYLNEIAKRMVGSTTQNDWRIRRGEEVRIPPSPSGRIPDPVRDTVRVANL